MLIQLRVDIIETPHKTKYICFIFILCFIFTKKVKEKEQA